MIDILRSKLQYATEQKILKQRSVFHLRNSEKILNEETSIIKVEMDFCNDQLQNIKQQISQTRQQITMINICSSSEKSKISNHQSYLVEHQKKFDDLHEHDRRIIDIRNKEARAKQEVIDEANRLKRKHAAEHNGQVAREIKMLEDECEDIEKECAILKKRNNAIMLKLRRKLVETEDKRRKLMNKSDNVE